MKFSVFQVSRKGGREKNEDRMGYCYTRESGLFVLADGMGGHPEGEVAAQLALQTISALYQKEARPVIRNTTEFLTTALMAAHQRNIEALTAANKVAMEGAQAFAHRQAEIVQQSVSELTEAMKSFSSVEAPQQKAAKQADMLKQTYERGVSNLRELGDLISRSNTEAVELLNRRFSTAMEEVKALASKK